MRVLVCGDRNWTDREVIKRQLGKLPPHTVIIEGEARGADLLARSVAEEIDFFIEPYPARWDVYGKAAGPIRNKQMLDEGKPDMVLAFHDNIQKSRGTKDMVMQASKRGIETIVIRHKVEMSWPCVHGVECKVCEPDEGEEVNTHGKG